MPGPATYASDVNVAERARAMLDEIADSVERMERVQREVVGRLVELWPVAGWRAAGVRSAKQWLHAHTGQSWNEAARLERIAQLCARDDRLAEAVVAGRFPLGWAETLSRAVTDERARFLTDKVVDALLGLADAGVADEQFGDAVRFWKERAEEHLAPRRVQPHTVVTSKRLFGGGDVMMSLAPVAYETFLTAMDAMTQDPDAKDAPYQRTLSERRADAVDDMATYVLTHGGHSDQGCSLGTDNEDESADAPFDGTTYGDTDLLDELLNTDRNFGEPGENWNPFALPTHPDPANDERSGSDPNRSRDDTNNSVEGDELDAMRRLLRKRVLQRQRRTHRQTRPRSGARVNVHIDIETLAGAREIHDLDGLVLRGEGWNLAKSAAEQFLCDSTLVATLFRGSHILDANADAEQFTDRQRRAIAARDRHCVFPGCRRPPRHCDAHHLRERNDGGPTIVDNGCLLCRFHHRLLHQYEWALRQDADGVVGSHRPPRPRLVRTKTRRICGRLRPR